MTKTQVKARLRPLLEKLYDIRAELDDLKTEVEETAENIEPYEGKDDLTDVQSERQTWLEEQASALDELIEAINTAEWDLDAK